MKTLKYVFVLGLMLALLTVPGCEMTSGQRVKILEKALVQVGEISDELGVRLTEMEIVLAETQTALADPNLPAEFREQMNDVLTQTIEGIKVVSAKRGEYAGLISRLRKQIEQAETGDMDFGAELSLYGEGLKETGKYLPPPVGPIVTIVGTVFGIIGMVLAKKRGGELVGVVKSVDTLLKSEAVPNIKKGINVLKGSQLPHIRVAVDKVMLKNGLTKVATS